MPSTSPKALIYCRVSSRAQATDGNGLDSQETRCRQFAEAKGFEVAAVFPDQISGGDDFMKRPGMVSLLSYIDADPTTRYVVIFDDLKRFARNTKYHLALREAFQNRGVQVMCPNYAFDDSPEGIFIETLLAAHGTLERQQNGRQVAQKMRARMENGYWIHNPPTGYVYQTFDGRGKVLVPNPPFDSLIIEAFEGFASGRFQTQAEVLRFFEAHPDFPRNKHGRITNQRVKDILTQPLYPGYICSKTYGINWLKGQHEALISLETYQKVQERLTGASYAPRRKNIGNDFVLRGFVECAGCGVPLRSSWSKGKTKHHPYYLCQTKGCDHYGKSIRRDVIENQVGAVIQTLQPTGDLIELATAMMRDAWEQRGAQLQEARAADRRQIAGIEKQLEKLLDRVVGASNDTVVRRYEQEIEKLEKEKALLIEKLGKKADPRGSFEEKLEPALQFLANPYKIWETAKIDLRRLVLKYAFTGRLKYCRNKGTRTPKLSIAFKALKVLEQSQGEGGAGGGT